MSDIKNHFLNIKDSFNKITTITISHISNTTNFVNTLTPDTKTFTSHQGLYILLGGVFCLLAIIISGVQIIMHLRFFTQPSLQLYIVRILLMIPVKFFIQIYCSCTWLGLCFPKRSIFFQLIQDCYESYVLYIFLQLLIQYLRGEDQMIKSLEISKVNFYLRKRLYHLFPLNYYYQNSFSLDKYCYRAIKKGVIQFVFLKPITTIFAFILYGFNLYDEGNFNFNNSYIYLSFVNNFSISISLYCLVLFYLGFENDLIHFNSLSKFLCIKFVLFFSFWQTFTFNTCLNFGWIELENAKLIQSLLMCFEMMLASVAQSIAFSHKDFVDYSFEKHEIYSNLKTVIDVTDIIDDAESTFTKDNEDRPLKDI